MKLGRWAKNEGRGAVNKLAEGLGVTHTVASRYISGVRRVPAERVLLVEEVTDSQVLRHEIRPDVFPEPAREAS